MRTWAAVAALTAALAVSACGDRTGAGEVLRLRHVSQRKLVYELTQHEEAPHPVVGLGGSLDLSETVQLACIGVAQSGTGHYEATVQQIKLGAPQASGAAVDTALGKPVEGDKIGANAVVLAMLPRNALIDIGTSANVAGAQPDPEIANHMTKWAQSKPVAARKAIFRLAEALDAGPVVHRWFGPLANILPPAERIRHGASWRATPPDIETPAGRLRPAIDVVYRKEGNLAVIEGKGTFVLDGEAPENRPVDFESGTLEMTAKIDLVRGVLVSYDEAGSFDFRMHDAEKLPAPWKHTRKVRLVE